MSGLGVGLRAVVIGECVCLSCLLFVFVCCISSNFLVVFFDNSKMGVKLAGLHCLGTREWLLCFVTREWLLCFVTREWLLCFV